MAVGGAVAGKVRERTRVLTHREHQMVEAVCDGLANREIAEKFKVSRETVVRHLSNSFDKIGCSSRLELAMMYKGRPGEFRAYVCDLCGTDKVIRETSDEPTIMEIYVNKESVLDTHPACPACAKVLRESIAKTIAVLGAK